MSLLLSSRKEGGRSESGDTGTTPPSLKDGEGPSTRSRSRPPPPLHSGLHRSFSSDSSAHWNTVRHATCNKGEKSKRYVGHPVVVLSGKMCTLLTPSFGSTHDPKGRSGLPVTQGVGGTPERVTGSVSETRREGLRLQWVGPEYRGRILRPGEGRSVFLSRPGYPSLSQTGTARMSAHQEVFSTLCSPGPGWTR